MKNQISVDASNARPTTTGVERGVDVDVNVTLPDGREVSGEVTLLPAEDGRPVYEAWGSPEHWVSPELLRELYMAALSGTDSLRRYMLSDLASAASAEAGTVAP